MDDATKVFQRVLDLVQANDMAGLAGLWAAEGTAEFPFAEVTPRVLTGREQVREYLADLPERMEVAEVSSARVHDTADPSTVLAEFTARGRTLRTGEPYEMSYVVVLTVRDGEIVRYRDYWNPVAAARAVGVLPELVAALDAQVRA